MERADRKQTPCGLGQAGSSDSWLFAQALLGKSVAPAPVGCAGARTEHERLNRLAQFSTVHERELRELWRVGADARRGREQLEWLAAISEEHASKLRGLAEGRSAGSGMQTGSADSPTWEEWDSTDHPRLGGPPNAGWFASAGRGSGASPGSNASDPSRWYLPSDEKGKWLGKKGESKFRLKKPVDVNGKLVRDIEYHNGVPVLDKFVLPGKTATIVLTGDSDLDIKHATEAWQKLNPGKELPKKATFHHDLLHATEHIEMVDGKKTKVLVGKMHLIPSEANKLVFHQGSASAAKKYYEGLGASTMSAIKRLAKEEASIAGKEGSIVLRAAGNIKPGRVAKGLLPFVGRNVARAIPIVGTGLAILEFADNVEAHGLDGALVRTVPVLGSLVSAHDLGTDLAKEITDDANAGAAEHERELNDPVDRSIELANDQTIDAFNELAPQIKVTNQRQSEHEPLVDPHEIADALKIYRGKMQQANLLAIEGAPGFDYDAAAARNKRELRQRLQQASQKNAPRTELPAM
jgi:hypothetical protein